MSSILRDVLTAKKEEIAKFLNNIMEEPADGQGLADAAIDMVQELVDLACETANSMNPPQLQVVMVDDLSNAWDRMIAEAMKEALASGNFAAPVVPAVGQKVRVTKRAAGTKRVVTMKKAAKKKAAKR
jgi:hypothetical protein